MPSDIVASSFPNFRSSVRRMAVAAALLFSNSVLAAQDCGGELPPPPEPELEKCGTFNVACKLRNEQKRDEFEQSSRSFTEITSVRSIDDEPEVRTLEHKVRGCRGETIVPEITAAA